jgi:uncharacterized protein YjiS (DUF1127 family)
MAQSNALAAAASAQLIYLERQMSKLSAADFANYRTTTRRFELSPVLRDLIEIVAVWIVRRRQRQALAELDEHLLDDVGLSREQARREAARPFWKR